MAIHAPNRTSMDNVEKSHDKNYKPAPSCECGKFVGEFYLNAKAVCPYCSTSVKRVK